MPNSTKFHSLALPEPLLTNLQSLGYNDMTPIQAASLPLILQQQDVVAQAKTGSGKTAAFGLGILAKSSPLKYNCPVYLSPRLGIRFITK